MEREKGRLLNPDADESLERARAHLRQATLEGLEAGRALLQFAMRQSGLADPATDSWLVSLQRNLEDLITGLRDNASFTLPTAISEPLAAALEAEIKRWERRSQTDPDARLVLRAFLGLRELLWELGMRHDAQPASRESRPNSDPRPAAPPARDRVQRFDVES